MTKAAKHFCLTIDVEEYFHAANLASECPIPTWHKLPSRVFESTEKLLNLYDEYNAKGTFFVLGFCAKRDPSLVRMISDRGHEVASHGYAHKIAYRQNKKQFKKDVERSKKLLEDICGQAVLGYRAPNFSIRDQNLWAYDTLVSCGYTYDSSLYPVHHHRYGNPHRKPNLETRLLPNGTLTILPIATLPIGNFRVPVGGGAYWRFLPGNIIRLAINSIIKGTQEPVISYLHPWEVDHHQPYFASLTWQRKLRHYYGTQGLESKIRTVLQNFSSTTIRLALDSHAGKKENDDKALQAPRV